MNIEETKNQIIVWIRDWFNRNSDNGNAIIGISGGKDSTIVASLCVKALGKDRVIGVLIPNGEDFNGFDIQDKDSYKVISYLGIKYVNVNINSAYRSIISEISGNKARLMKDYYNSSKTVSEQTKINLAPRLRMSTLYAVAQTYNGRVVNTSNLSEYMSGYFTKFGDECGDLKPLINFTKTEVVEIGKALNLPIELIEKAPSDGLTGKTDEEKFGYTYEEIDSYIRNQYNGSEEQLNKIKSVINKTSFKRKTIESFEPKNC